MAINPKTREIISRACAFLREKGLTQRRSPTGTRKVIGFENPEENNEWEMPVGVGRQYDRRPDRKAEYGQLRCVT